MKMTAHVETGEPLPEDLFNKIVQSRNFRAGSDMLRQLNFGMLDMELHHRFEPTGSDSVFDVAERIARQTSALEPLSDDRFLCSFSHIFAGGYSAGYYSYKWAEVMSADAFGAFEEVGLEDAGQVAETGRRFRDTVLALGGSRHPNEVFEAFRGRRPTTEALLRHSGLLKSA
jgi:oligopeptidase A